MSRYPKSWGACRWRKIQVLLIFRIFSSCTSTIKTNSATQNLIIYSGAMIKKLDMAGDYFDISDVMILVDFPNIFENHKIEILDFHQLRKALSQKPTRSTVWNFSMLFVETIRLICKKIKIITVSEIFRKSIRKSSLTKILIPLILRLFWWYRRYRRYRDVAIAINPGVLVVEERSRCSCNFPFFLHARVS